MKYKIILIIIISVFAYVYLPPSSNNGSNLRLDSCLSQSEVDHTYQVLVDRNLIIKKSYGDFYINVTMWNMFSLHHKKTVVGVLSCYHYYHGGSTIVCKLIDNNTGKEIML